MKAFLDDKFCIKDLGSLKYFLGLEVARSSCGIYICQRKYALDKLTDSSMLSARPTFPPVDQKIELTKTNDSLLDDPTVYRRLVVRLLYLTITWPDLTYSAQVLSQFIDHTRKPHLDAAYKVLQYI